jgi:hypothetical protein
VHCSRECTPPYLSNEISNLLQPAQAGVVVCQHSSRENFVGLKVSNFDNGVDMISTFKLIRYRTKKGAITYLILTIFLYNLSMSMSVNMSISTSMSISMFMLITWKKQTKKFGNW